MYSAQLSERLAVVATIDPVSQGAGTVLTDAVDMSKFSRVIFILILGAMTTNSTVDFKLREAATSGGTYSDITGKSVTQLTQASTDDNKQVVVEIKNDELTDGKQFVKGSLTVAVAATVLAVIALGEPRYLPAADVDLTSVDEIVA
jgi:hypothetical protein